MTVSSLHTTSVINRQDTMNRNSVSRLSQDIASARPALLTAVVLLLLAVLVALLQASRARPHPREAEAKAGSAWKVKDGIGYIHLDRFTDGQRSKIEGEMMKSRPHCRRRS